MKKTLKTNKALFISLSILFIVTLLLGTYRIPYSFRAPGYNATVDEFLTIDSPYEAQGTFHTTSVIAYDKVTVLQYLVGNMMPKVDIKEFPNFYEGIDLNDLTIMGILMKDDSLQTALIVAIEHAGLPIVYDSYNTVYLTYSHMTPDTLEPGDKIITVNGSTDYLAELSNTACHETADITVLRDDQEITFTLTKNEVNPILPNSACSFGLYIDVLSEIVDTDVTYTLEETSTQGPSGGLLQTLYIFNELTEYDYTHGLKISGTGTIDVNGNVGYIGSVRQKIITSIANDIDIFFVPYLTDEDYDNYIEAISVLEEFNTDMKVIGVSTFEEAIAYLESIGE